MPPTIDTSRLILRTPDPADAEAVFELARDHAIADTTASVPHPYARDMADGFVAWATAPGSDDQRAVWALVRRTDASLLGVVSLSFAPEISSAELGYWVGVPYWGQGFITEASVAVLDHGFRERSLASVFGIHFARNPASHRVMAKLGMREEGVLRRRFRKWDVLEDLCHHSILREEWPR